MVIAPGKGAKQAGLKANQTGFGTSAGPAPFRGGIQGVVRARGKRMAPASVNTDRMEASNLSEGEARKPKQRNLLGPRISHIGKGAISNTYLLEGLNTGQTRQAQLFNTSPIASRARQTGRPLGYGTVYKFF